TRGIATLSLHDALPISGGCRYWKRGTRSRPAPTWRTGERTAWRSRRGSGTSSSSYRCSTSCSGRASGSLTPGCGGSRPEPPQPGAHRRPLASQQGPPEAAPPPARPPGSRKPPQQGAPAENNAPAGLPYRAAYPQQGAPAEALAGAGRPLLRGPAERADPVAASRGRGDRVGERAAGLVQLAERDDLPAQE